MNLNLEDIIDLEYLLHHDGQVDTIEKTIELHKRDRDIYLLINKKGCDKKYLLLNWLKHQREYTGSKKGDKKFSFLPGTLFSILYRIMKYIMIVTGLLSGISIVSSFLTYHGAQPINVTVFVMVFILVPLVLIIVSSLLGLYCMLGFSRSSNSSPFSIIYLFLYALMFKGLPYLLQKYRGEKFKKNLDAIEFITQVVKQKKIAYKGLFFWPFFMLTSWFSIGFSTGSLGGTFFKIMVRDLAFGWQSTVLASSQTMYEIVSKMAWPWINWIPEFLACPGIDQIKGSRIVLKNGINVLATQDLVSWWPFLCMGIVFYAIIPRAVLLLGGYFAQKKALLGFDFNTHAFNDLIARMKSPVLSVDAGETLVKPGEKMDKSSLKPDPVGISGQSALVLISRQVYGKKAEQIILNGIKTGILYKVQKVLDIEFDIEADTMHIKKSCFDSLDLVILVQEAWQPPVRGLLYYIKQIHALLPPKVLLLVLLTSEANFPEKLLPQDDMDFKIWKKAVYMMNNPKILARRFINHDS